MKNLKLLSVILSVVLLCSFNAPLKKKCHVVFYTKLQNIQLFVGGQKISQSKVLSTQPTCGECSCRHVYMLNYDYPIQVLDANNMIMIKGHVNLRPGKPEVKLTKGSLNCEFKDKCDRYEIKLGE